MSGKASSKAPVRRPLRLAALLLAVALAGLWPVAANAITGGTPDGDAHPYVGALIYPGTTLPVCSGVLVRSSSYGAVFLTAAHCLPAAAGRSAYGRAVRVAFASAVSPASRFYSGTYYGDPDYTDAAIDSHDLAVVVFSRRPPIPALRLAPVGALSVLPGLKSSDFTVVGYGFPTLGVRQHSTERGQSLTAHWLDLVPDPNGPACDVDSGGPALLRQHGRTYVTATTIGGDQTCQRFDQDLRVDTLVAHRYVNEAHA